METRGFVWQLQPTSMRVRSDMQEAEQDMATDVMRKGLPIVGTYATPNERDLTNALDIARQQWEAASRWMFKSKFKEEAIPSEGHKLGSRPRSS